MKKNAYPLTMIFICLLLAGAVLASALNPPQQPPANALTNQEKAQGWMLLFDGKTFAGWRGLGYDRVPQEHWVIDGGAIMKVPTKNVPLQKDGQPVTGGDLITIAEFEDFELAFDWKISSGGNSGVKYNVSEEMSTANPASHAALGFEYQVLDDDRHPDAKNGPNRTAGALYDLIGPRGGILKPVGEFNTAKIVFVGRHGEHWLNGVKILEFELGTPAFEALFVKSKYKDIPGFADKRKGHIVLQDHTDAVWYRNIKIRVVKK